jgi:hypothetical protein
MAPSRLRDCSNRLIDWFWDQGRLRQGNHALGTGTWLSRAYDIREVADALVEMETKARYCRAIWGPSQSGKSTLLSRYLDQGSGEFVSSLQWTTKEPVLLVGRPDAPPDYVALNTYQGKADASGCTTRFVLQTDVPDPEHPVRLELATDQQIMLALAIGYITECDARTSTGEDVFLDEQKLGAMLAAREDGPPRQPNRAAYERLSEVVSVLRELVFAGWTRYRNLTEKWPVLSARLLETPGLLASVEAADAFAAEILWDKQPAISRLYAKLCAQRARILRLTHNQPIVCSYRVAAVFLNMAAYRQLIQTGRDRARVLGFRANAEASRYLIGNSGSGAAFDSEEDFGLWQGLIWEIVVPVNRKVMAATSPVATKFLEEADLLDFPGVALSHAGGFKKRAEQLSADELLTEVLKRGKTASIVATRSRHLEILGFSIMNQFQEPPAQPDQLITGIQAWARHLGMSLADQHLPLSLILTFGAKPINEQIFQLRINREEIDFGGVFSWLEKLGPLADPARVPLFTITYPHLPLGRINGTPEEIERAAGLVVRSAAFKRWFRHPESFLEMTRHGVSGDGGTDYLLGQLSAQSRNTQLPALLAARQRGLVEQLDALLNWALPANPSQIRATDLRDWQTNLEAAIVEERRARPLEDAAHRVGSRVRKLMNVEPELLESLPRQGGSQELHDYVARQFLRWQESRTCQAHDWRQVGLADSGAANRVLGYLCDCAMLQGGIDAWLRQNFGHPANRREAAYARRFLAIKMADLLCFSKRSGPGHRAFSGKDETTADLDSESIDIRLRGYAARELEERPEHLDSDSPHYRGFLEPFLAHLQAASKLDAGARPAQPGDEELRKLQLAFGPS